MSSSHSIYTSLISSLLHRSTDISSKSLEGLPDHKVPVTEPLPDKIMTVNNTGGYVFEVTPEKYFERILTFGTTSPTYYQNANMLSTEAITFIQKQIDEGKGLALLAILCDYYEKSRAPKMQPLIATLAQLCSKKGLTDKDDVEKGYRALRVASLKVVTSLRTFSHLSEWKGYHHASCGSKGFGRATRDAIAKIFSNRTAESLAYQIVKYGGGRTVGKDKWSVKDMVTCAHVVSKSLSPNHQVVIAYAVKGIEDARAKNAELQPSETKILDYLEAVEKAKNESTSIEDIIELISKHNLPREALNTKALKDPRVWRKLLVNDDGKIIMPITALIRNLGVMSNRGLFDDASLVSSVAEFIQNENVLKRGHIHPVSMLEAWKTYGSGRGLKGSLMWSVNKKIHDALEAGFYLAFSTLKPTGKDTMHCIDCSGSMGTMSTACSLTAREAAAAVAMVASRADNGVSRQDFNLFTASSGRYYGITFSGETDSVEGLTPTTITPGDDLKKVINAISRSDFGSTDASLPFRYALKKFVASGGKDGKYEVFCVYTDNEVNSGVHPASALKEYRRVTGINAKLIVFAMTPTEFTIADPADPGMLDVQGFDSCVPTIYRNFVCSEDNSHEDTSDDIITEE